MKTKVVVELDIYSGMPNPRWHLSDSEVAAFENLLAGAREPATGEVHSRLGYRGFVVEVKQGGEASEIRVQGGLIHVVSRGANTTFLDRNRALERWLLETGRKHLPGDVLADAEKALQTP